MAAMAPPGGGRNAFSQRLQVITCFLCAKARALWMTPAFKYEHHMQVALRSNRGCCNTQVRSKACFLTIKCLVFVLSPAEPLTCVCFDDGFS